MKRAVLAVLPLACVVPLIHAQSADPAVTFEVASVKPSGPPEPRPTAGGGMMMVSGCHDGPGSQNPGRYVCEHATLTSIVSNAYELKRYQYSFPSWMGSTYFEVSARVPEKASKEQFRQMKQNLLAERFKLVAHFEKKEIDVYELTVGKDGPKLKETPEQSETAGNTPLDLSKVKKDGEGMPVIPVRPGGTAMSMMNGPNGALMRMTTSGQTMEQFVSQLSSMLNKPVTDATGLKGKYDITLTCAPPDGLGLRVVPSPGAVDRDAAATPPTGDAGPTIFAAVQQQLGLKLEPKKGSVDFLVIDSIEKTPVEN